MSESDPLVVFTRRRGRPTADDPLAPISTRLPTAAVDQLARIALRHDLPLAALVRELVLGCLDGRHNFRIE